MEQNRVTVDAHTLIWYVHEPSRKHLSALALETIRDAERDGIVYVPTIVLLEILRIIEKGRYPLSFDALLFGLERSMSYEIIPFDVRLLRVSMTLQDLTLHDRIIAATAMITNSSLVSKDRTIGTPGVTVVW
jgi:PIN domain nuclease of toxin-antitoxin system